MYKLCSTIQLFNKMYKTSNHSISFMYILIYLFATSAIIVHTTSNSEMDASNKLQQQYENVNSHHQVNNEMFIIKEIKPIEDNHSKDSCS